MKLPLEQIDRNVAQSITIVRWLIASWLALLALGVFTLRLPDALEASRQISFYRCVFTATNTSSLTGFGQTFAGVSDYRHTVQLIFLMQTLSGALLSLIGGGLLLSRVIGSPHGPSRIATAALSIVAAAGLLGFATISQGEPIVMAISRGVGAVSGSGLIFGTPRTANDATLHMLLIPLSILGVLGTIVINDIFDRITKGRSLSIHSTRALGIGGACYLLGAIAIVVIFISQKWTLDPKTWKLEELIAWTPRAGALAGSAIGYGYSSELISQLPRGIDWVLMAIMITGVGTAGTGGWGLAWLGTLPPRFTKLLLGTLGVQAALVLVAIIVLLQTEPQLAADQVLMLGIGAITNIGLSHAPVTIAGDGLLVLSALMIAGKLLPLWVLTELTEHKS